MSRLSPKITDYKNWSDVPIPDNEHEIRGYANWYCNHCGYETTEINLPITKIEKRISTSHMCKLKGHSQQIKRQIGKTYTRKECPWFKTCAGNCVQSNSYSFYAAKIRSNTFRNKFIQSKTQSNSNANDDNNNNNTMQIDDSNNNNDNSIQIQNVDLNANDIDITTPQLHLPPLQSPEDDMSNMDMRMDAPHLPIAHFKHFTQLQSHSQPGNDFMTHQQHKLELKTKHKNRKKSRSRNVQKTPKLKKIGKSKRNMNNKNKNHNNGNDNTNENAGVNIHQIQPKNIYNDNGNENINENDNTNENAAININQNQPKNIYQIKIENLDALKWPSMKSNKNNNNNENSNIIGNQNESISMADLQCMMSIILKPWNDCWNLLMKEKEYGAIASPISSRHYWNILEMQLKWNIIGFCMHKLHASAKAEETEVAKWNRIIIQGINNGQWGNVYQYVHNKSINSQKLTYSQSNDTENFYIFHILKMVIIYQCQGPSYGKQAYSAFKGSLAVACPWPIIIKIMDKLFVIIPNNRLGILPTNRLME